MAGSYNHCVDDECGKLYKPQDLQKMIETPGDVYGAVEEFYGMVWYLAYVSTQSPEEAEALVERARQNYKVGLKTSPGLYASLSKDN